ncbi:GTP-sensing pleiotropic transcriptional regulator CodY [Aceticella autotrophica]|uniref:Global transcriptional regulator CodY n=1 Tax=Aceticella autotrophica TaxID=2755338 RepID=A0A974Y331_9THEO|nr:GTP-sensing pleiotropic transcriptional regulator CodY [Aceticella autotrophica]QSZ26616.1 GTP-sensing pleiotropic transcriptional regulator CodY [Aceticella autotrophica]
MEKLLDKIRKVNRILQQAKKELFDFNELAQILNDVIDCNVYILSRKGKLLGLSLLENFETSLGESSIVTNKAISSVYNKKLLKISETKQNVTNKDNIYPFEESDKFKFITIVPVNGGGERVGTLLLAKIDNEFTEDDLILAEYGATVIGLEILRSKNEELEEETRKRAVVQMALGTLSYSELEAVNHIFNELDGNEGLLVASKIADKVGITRSVIVNALRKFESAGVIESRSLGMKGTHIKVLNDKLIEELKKIKR